ncbi:MAG: chemotaxis protein CheC [Aulosira sp. ZfuVER01]|nr:chemotaxis protein CheC [Aulosira sp. ZfuVER01]MDZ7999094.1 chemotaxis protein CheC [Aulosira sp. DedVER01a]MDZ8051182.1 chemotaxis protein CheC [Aulosira sp. ZfuCHP01]
MVLTDEQKDALTELINIGFSRTASSLSELTGYRVMLDVPQISIHPIRELAPKLATFVQGEVATVQQIFKGPVSGNALLLLNYEGAVTLTDLFTPENNLRTHRLDAAASEVLTEVGNILLNACLGIFGNLLEIQISFSVPRLHLEALDGLLNSLVIGKEELRYAMVIYTAFHIRENSVSGYLVMVLGVASLECLIQAVDRWANVPIYNG